jgi:hypothetical protein
MALTTLPCATALACDLWSFFISNCSDRFSTFFDVRDSVMESDESENISCSMKSDVKVIFVSFLLVAF